MTRNDFLGAIEDLDRAVEINAEYAEAFYVRGLLQQVLGDLEAALADLSKAVELAPDQPQPYVARAGIFQEMERYEEALIDLQQGHEHHAAESRAVCGPR